MNHPAIDVAGAYLALGWQPIPLRGKAPAVGDGWPDWRADPTDLAPFAGRNVGVLLGEPSGGLVDVDLDVPEAVEVAPRHLPETWTFGRVSTPRAHWLYVAAGARTAKYRDPLPNKDGKHAMLVEVRSTGAQTMFPGSVHPDCGERVEWTPDDADSREAPRTIDPPALVRRVQCIAAGALAIRHGGAAGRAWALEGGPYPPLPAAADVAVREWLGVQPASSLRRAGSRRHGPGRPVAGDPSEAVARYCRDRARSLPRSGATCPICGHQGCFGRLPRAAERWACWSTAHGDVGLRGRDCMHGDVLDLDAHAAGVSRVEHLRASGYLAEVQHAR